MADGTNLSSQRHKPNKYDIFNAKQGPNNVAININKFIAKYDFEIASKLRHEEKEALAKDQQYVRQ